MADPRQVGHAIRRRMGAESSTLGMAQQDAVGRQEIRDHLSQQHGFSESDFGLFGDSPSLGILHGAHGQEHDYNPNVDHAH